MGAQEKALKAVFTKMCKFGGAKDPKKMDGRTLVKCMKESKVKEITSTDCDMVFAKVAGRGVRKIQYPKFIEVLEALAKRKDMKFKDLADKIVGAGGPKTGKATKADNVRLAKKENSCGVHKNGGPSTVDGVGGLSGMCDRTECDIRGLNLN